MIALDTNVLARFLLEDDARDYAYASNVIAAAIKDRGIFIASPVFVELVWLLRKEGWDKARVCSQLGSLTSMPNVHVAYAVADALKLYQEGKADFADYLILCESRESGAKKLASFDSILIKEQEKYCKHPKVLAEHA